jgi:hypothetical protein
MNILFLFLVTKWTIKIIGKIRLEANVYIKGGVIIMSGRLSELWDWFWYYRRRKIKYNVMYVIGDTYCASASTKDVGVYNCYGSTPELAKEIAAFKLKQAINRTEKGRTSL